LVGCVLFALFRLFEVSLRLWVYTERSEVSPARKASNVFLSAGLEQYKARLISAQGGLS